MSPEIRLAPIEARNAAHRGGGGPHPPRRCSFPTRVSPCYLKPFSSRPQGTFEASVWSSLTTSLSLSLSFSRAIKATRDLGYEVLFSGHLTTVRAVPLPSRVVVDAVPTVASRGAALAVSVAAVSPV